MNDVHYTTTINATKEKVWETMLGQDTYPEWTSVFMPGSFYKGEWVKGNMIDFLAKDDDGVESGMRAQVVESIPYEFLSLEHLAEVKGDAVEPLSTVGSSFENYTFTEQGGVTEVRVDLLNIPHEWVEMMNDAWPKALNTLKEITEK